MHNMSDPQNTQNLGHSECIIILKREYEELRGQDVDANECWLCANMQSFNFRILPAPRSVWQGRVGSGRAGQGRGGPGGSEQVGSGWVGSGQVGLGQVEVGRVVSGQDGSGRVGSGGVASDRVGSDRVGWGGVGTCLPDYSIGKNHFLKQFRKWSSFPVREKINIQQ